MKKLISLLCVVLAALFCCACAQPDDSGENNTPNEPQGLEYGFTASGGCEPQPSGQCAYRSDTDIFDIDDVTLTFYYGDNFLDVESRRDSKDVPYFELYFTNDNDDEAFVRRVDENYISEKYKVSDVRDENNHVTGYQFNHSEEITIPQEIFTENEGRVYFCVRGINIKMPEQIMENLNGTVLLYKKLDDNKIQLFTNEYRG